MALRVTRRSALILLALAVCACGYKAHVRGLLNPASEVRPAAGAKIHVQLDPSGKQTELNTMVANKLGQLLVEHGYEQAGEDEAEFFLLYDYEIRSMMNRVKITPYQGTLSGFHTVRQEGPFDQTLSLKLVKATTFHADTAGDFVWAGGAVLHETSTTSPKIVDLLLVAGFKYFPEDTQHVVTVRMGLNDPRAKRLRATEWYPESRP